MTGAAQPAIFQAPLARGALIDMKLPLSLAVCLAVAITPAAMGQGTVNFANRVVSAGIDAPVFSCDGITPVGDSFVAQLWAGADANSLAPVGAAVEFISLYGRGTGYFVGGSREILGIPPGGAAWTQVRVWDRRFPDFGSAVATGGLGVWGTSNLLRLAATGDPTASPPALPVNLVGLTDFSVFCMPEPTTLALLGLGALGPLLRRRK